MMQKVAENSIAALIFDRISVAVIGENACKPIAEWELDSIEQKSFSPEFRSIGWSTSSQSPMGFFIASVMDTLDNGLESVSFHAKTGHHQPHDASLANLVKVYA